MRVAIAGTSDVGRYFVEEFLAASHSVVVLSRSPTPKPWYDRSDITYRATDYTVPSLLAALSDCDAIVSTIQELSMDNVTVHVNILEACRQSPKCKKFIPSEWGGNLDDLPTKPRLYYENHEPVRQALRAQKEVTWTLFNIGLLSEYIVPANQRHLKDVGPYHPVDLNTGIMTIPGSGNELIAFTATRDVGRAVARLLEADEWEETTYICGETTSWNAMKDMLERNGVKLEAKYIPLEEIRRMLREGDEEEVIAAEFMEYGLEGGRLPEEKLKRQEEKYFKGMKWKGLEEMLIQAQKNPGVIV